MIESLRKVQVSKPPDKIIEAGNNKLNCIFNPLFPGMKSRHCQTNSICVVEAMIEKGQKDWHVVPGYAYGPQQERPFIHVWIRNGPKHYDPTWSLKSIDWNVEDLVYFQLVRGARTQPAESKRTNRDRILDWGEEICKGLKKFAKNKNIAYKDRGI